MSHPAPEEAAEAGDVTVLLVDDHAIVRGGVRSMLAHTEFRVVGEAASGKEALDAVSRLLPRLVLMDVRMPGADGLDTLPHLKKQHPEVGVVLLTTFDNPTYFARAVADGAAGYLLKGVKRDELLVTLRAVANGEMLLKPQDLVRALRGISDKAVASDDLIEPLTDREQEVLRLLATGLCNRDIAAVLFVTENTIKTHVKNVIGKLGVSDRVQAAVWAAQHGLTPPA